MQCPWLARGIVGRAAERRLADAKTWRQGDSETGRGQDRAVVPCVPSLLVSLSPCVLSLSAFAFAGFTRRCGHRDGVEQLIQLFFGEYAFGQGHLANGSARLI